MSTSKTCAISSLRWLPVSALIYGLADFSKHESAPPLSPKFVWNNRKQKKIAREEDGPPACPTKALSLLRISVAVYDRRTGQRPVFRTMRLGQCAERKGWTVSERTNNPETGAGIFAAFRIGGGMARCLGSCPEVEG